MEKTGKSLMERIAAIEAAEEEVEASKAANKLRLEVSRYRDALEHCASYECCCVWSNGPEGKGLEQNCASCAAKSALDDFT